MCLLQIYSLGNEYPFKFKCVLLNCMFGVRMLNYGNSKYVNEKDLRFSRRCCKSYKVWKFTFFGAMNSPRRAFLYRFIQKL